MLDTQKPFVLMYIPQNKEVTLWIGGNDNEMYIDGGPIDYDHDVGALVLIISFFWFLFVGFVYL